MSRRHPPNPQLGKWVDSQRTAYRHYMKSKESGIPLASIVPRISDEHIALVESVGFVWAVFQRGVSVPWEQRYEELKAYKEEHGECLVPNKYQLKPKLAKWVGNQRSAYRY